MRFDEIDAALAAIRATGGDDPDRAEETQLRVRRSLERRARGRHQLIGLTTTVAILFAGTVSWTLATGHVAALWMPVREPARAEPPQPELPEPARSTSRPRKSMAVPPLPSLPPETVTPLAPVVSAPTPRPLDSGARAARRAATAHAGGDSPIARRRESAPVRGIAR